MKTRPFAILSLLLACLPLRAEDEIEKAFRDALYAEEVKGDTEAALKAYQEVAAKFEQQRDMAATALFRQAECLRKLGRKDEAAALYNKVLAQYGDKERVAKLSRENLAALGVSPSSPGDVGGVSSVATDAAEVARLEKLLSDSPDLVNATDISNPLAVAAEKGQVALVDYLLGKGARVDTVVDGKSALHRAAEAGHLTVCQKLLDKGADVNQKSGNATPLVLALDKGRFAVAELLLDRKADVNLGYLSRSQPAVPGSNLTEHRRSQEYPALSLALLRDAPASLVLRLLQGGADPARPVVEIHGSTVTKTWPLAEAIRRRELEVVAAMLQKGAPVNQPVAGDEWPMDLAMNKARPSAPEATDDAVVEALRQHGADLKRDAVIRSAVLNGHAGYVRAAVKDGASPQHFDAAIAPGRMEMLKLLLELGADPAKEHDDYGRTVDALSVAIDYSNLEAVEMIVAAGYPLSERLERATVRASYRVFTLNDKPSREAQQVFEFFREEAERSGVLAAAMTKALDDSVRPGGTNQDNLALLRLGANAWKAASVSALFENQSHQFGITRRDYLPLWQAARLLQNPQLRTAVWMSRGPSLKKYDEQGRRHVFTQSGAQYRPFFRTVISAEGVVPPGSLGRFLSVARWNVNADDLSAITVFRVGEGGKIAEHKVDFFAIIRSGDVTKDFALQWGDVVEIPPAEDLSPGADPATGKARIEIQEAAFEFQQKHYGEIEIALTIGDDQVVTNAMNEKGAVLRAGGFASMSGPAGLFSAAGIPVVWNPPLSLEVRRPGEDNFTPLPVLNAVAGEVKHGDRVRIVPPVKEPALSEAALREACTLAVSESGPFLRILSSEMQELAAAFPNRPRERVETMDPFAKRPARRLRELLLLLRAPNPLGFSPVHWPAARLKLAVQDGWEEMPLEKAPPEWLLVPGMMLILPALDPEAPIPPDTFDYADCAFDYELSLGDQPPLQRRYQPPVPQLKREGDRWVWTWQRKEGDSGCAFPDLYSVLSEVPEVRAWPGYNGAAIVSGEEAWKFSKVDLLNEGGAWLGRDWKNLRLIRIEPRPVAVPQPFVPGQTQVIPQPLNPQTLPRRRVATP